MKKRPLFSMLYSPICTTHSILLIVVIASLFVFLCHWMDILTPCHWMDTLTPWHLLIPCFQTKLPSLKIIFWGFPLGWIKQTKYIDILIIGCATCLWSLFWTEMAWFLCLGPCHGHLVVLEKKNCNYEFSNCSDEFLRQKEYQFVFVYAVTHVKLVICCETVKKYPQFYSILFTWWHFQNWQISLLQLLPSFNLGKVLS